MRSFGKGARPKAEGVRRPPQPGAIAVAAAVFILAAAGGATLSRTLLKPGYGVTSDFVAAEMERYADAHPGV
ncbi:MAG: hypothetical protein K2Q06_14500, partial [Parvularculaceae bacterium]|nr:hypothetical protein [Parvularculaceae bacterium]